MNKPNPAVMIDWIQQIIKECEVSLTYYHNNPDEDKAMQRRRAYATDLARFKERLSWWNAQVINKEK